MDPAFKYGSKNTTDLILKLHHSFDKPEEVREPHGFNSTKTQHLGLEESIKVVADLISACVGFDFMF